MSRRFVHLSLRIRRGWAQNYDLIVIYDIILHLSLQLVEGVRNGAKGEIIQILYNRLYSACQNIWRTCRSCINDSKVEQHFETEIELVIFDNLFLGIYVKVLKNCAFVIDRILHNRWKTDYLRGSGVSLYFYIFFLLFLKELNKIFKIINLVRSS